MAINKLCIYAFLCVLPICVHTTSYKDCGSGLSKVASFTIGNCPDGKKPCEIKRGSNSWVEVKFIPYTRSKNLTCQLLAVLMDDPIEWEVKRPDACKNSGISCPLLKGQKYTYYNELIIDESIPLVELPFRFVLKNENNETVVCTEVIVEINDEWFSDVRQKTLTIRWERKIKILFKWFTKKRNRLYICVWVKGKKMHFLLLWNC